MFQYITKITIIPLYDSDSRCRDFYASHADLKTQFIADFVPKDQNIKMSAMSSKTMTKHPQEISCPYREFTQALSTRWSRYTREGG